MRTSFIYFGILLALVSCGKSSFLDKNPNTDNVIPSSMEDFQALLDNTTVMGVTPVLGELSSDCYVLDYDFWQNLDDKQRNAYIWAKDIYEGQGKIDDWNLPYQQVFYANVVLEGLSKLKTDSAGNSTNWRGLKGSALFLRAYAFYNIAQVFGPAYDQADPNLPGIPLRLGSEILSVSTRATLGQTYQQILGDLLQAKDLLPAVVASNNPNRPSRPAAFAMLARVYLSMRMYDQANLYADSCLQTTNQLLDYNGVPQSSFLPFTYTNREMIYMSTFLTTTPQMLVGVGSVKVAMDLYNSYDTNDLRKKLFYRINGAGFAVIRPGYSGIIYPFSGLATDEVYLIRAECRVRAGDVAGGMDDLNALLGKRWATGTFTPLNETVQNAALDKILMERKKELVFRGIRWSDLRRLNKEGANLTLTRNLNGTVYTLVPNSKNYVLPIPPDVLNLTHMLDNERD